MNTQNNNNNCNIQQHAHQTAHQIINQSFTESSQVLQNSINEDTSLTNAVNKYQALQVLVNKSSEIMSKTLQAYITDQIARQECLIIIKE